MATGEHEKVANGKISNVYVYAMIAVLLMLYPLSQGLFENYLSVKFKDPNLEAVS